MVMDAFHNGKWTTVVVVKDGVHRAEQLGNLSLEEKCDLHDYLGALIQEEALSRPAIEVVP